MRTAKLGEICVIQSGGTPARSNNKYWENGTIPWIKISDMDGKFVVECEEKISELGLENSSAKLFPEGTILFSIFATLGAVAILGMPAATNQAIAGITVTDSTVSREYVYYFLLSIENKVKEIGRGVAQNNINLSILKKFEISLPIESIQESIVSTLDTIQSLISHYKQQLELLDTLVKARFVEMFGDPVTVYPFSILQNVVDIGSSKRIYAKDYVETGVPFYRSKEIRELAEGKKPTVELFIEQSKYEEVAKKYGVPKAGDILLTAVGTIGYMWIVDGDMTFYYKDGNLVLLSNLRDVSPIYLKAVLEDVITKMKEKNINGSAYMALTIEKLKKEKIPIPPLFLQNEFADYVHQVEKTKADVQKSLDKTQMLFDSLMQEYFG